MLEWLLSKLGSLILVFSLFGILTSYVVTFSEKDYFTKDFCNSLHSVENCDEFIECETKTVKSKKIYNVTIVDNKIVKIITGNKEVICPPLNRYTRISNQSFIVNRNEELIVKKLGNSNNIVIKKG